MKLLVARFGAGSRPFAPLYVCVVMGISTSWTLVNGLCMAGRKYSRIRAFQINTEEVRGRERVLEGWYFSWRTLHCRCNVGLLFLIRFNDALHY